MIDVVQTPTDFDPISVILGSLGTQEFDELADSLKILSGVGVVSLVDSDSAIGSLVDFCHSHLFLSSLNFWKTRCSQVVALVLVADGHEFDVLGVIFVGIGALVGCW